MADIAIGSAVASNFILAADLFGATITGPTRTQDGKDVGTASEDVTFDVSGIGVSATYYIMPSNMYVSAGAGMAMNTVELDGKAVGETGTGWGVNAMLGKEWWVSDNWGLGVAGQVIYASVPDEDKDNDKTYTVNTMAFGVLFSATYN